jgi:hypothetical protein
VGRALSFRPKLAAKTVLFERQGGSLNQLDPLLDVYLLALPNSAKYLKARCGGVRIDLGVSMDRGVSMDLGVSMDRG